MEVSVNRLHPARPLGGWQTRGSGPRVLVCACNFRGWIPKFARWLERQTCCFKGALCKRWCCVDALQGPRGLRLILHLQAQDAEAKCLNLRHMLPLSQTPNVLRTVPWKDVLFPGKMPVRSATGEWSRYRVQASAAGPRASGFSASCCRAKTSP